MSRWSLIESDTSSPYCDTHTRVSSRAKIVESLRQWAVGVAKEELRRKAMMPRYLRVAMLKAMRSRDLDAVDVDWDEIRYGEEHSPVAPMVVFINARSGGRQGPVLKNWLQELMGEEQVFDLAMVKPSDFVQYGLACLEKLADLGDYCARETREKFRIMVAGGDGTVGWVLGSLGELYLQNREPVPPIGIIPLGTGNDLSRSFGWGGSFPFVWRTSLKHSLRRAINGPLCHLDSWHVVVSMPSEETVELPHSLRHLEDCTLDQDESLEEELPERLSCFGGVFYNYFSIGMDAQVAYGFHHLRDEKPYLAQGSITNKLIYTGYSCAQGWFLTSCMGDPSLRGLKNILRLYIKKIGCSEWEQIQVPPSVRAVVALNLHNYGSGRNPWGNLKPDYLIKRGFVEAHADDGLLEIFGLKQGWHASAVMVELVPAKHIAQRMSLDTAIRLLYIVMQASSVPFAEIAFHSYGCKVSAAEAWWDLEAEQLVDGYLEMPPGVVVICVGGAECSWLLFCSRVVESCTRATAIRLEIRGGQWKYAYMQMDGEPWRQPMSSEYSTFVEIKRVPYQSLLIRGD